MTKLGIHHLHVRVTGKTLLLLKKQRFIHGTAHLNDRMAVLFFFKEIDMGMLVCTVGAESKFVRFTSYMVKADEPLSFSPTTSKLIH